jgi:hypothetical protein
MTMKAWRHLGLAVAVLAWTVTGCTGGSGSSGFDIRENLVIEDALGSGDCQDFEGLRICPADTGTPAQPTAPPTPKPTPTFTPPLISGTPTPATESPLPVTGTPTLVGPSTTATATLTRTPRATEAPPTAQATRTEKPVPPMQVDTNLSGANDIVCFPGGAESCTVQFLFATTGFPDDAVYRTAVRESDDQPWKISQPTDLVDNQPGRNAFADSVQIGKAGAPAEVDDVQFAVLIFLTDPGPVPEMVDKLGDTGANFAYVLNPVSLTLEEAP